MPRGIHAKLADEVRTCVYCGEPFRPRQDGQLYCRPAHKNAAQLQRHYDEAFGSKLGDLEKRVKKLEKAAGNGRRS